MQITFHHVDFSRTLAERTASMATSILLLAGAGRKISPTEDQVSTLGIIEETDLVLLAESDALAAVNRAASLIRTGPDVALQAQGVRSASY